MRECLQIEADRQPAFHIQSLRISELNTVKVIPLLGPKFIHGCKVSLPCIG